MIIGCDYSTKFVHLGWLPNEWRRFPVDDDLSEFMLQIGFYLPAIGCNGGQMYIERPWSRYNPGTALTLQRIATIIDCIATQAGYETHWVAIPAWRSAVFGKGKYDSKTAKQLALALVQERCGLELTDDNAADALCLAIYGEMMQ